MLFSVSFVLFQTINHEFSLINLEKTNLETQMKGIYVLCLNFYVYIQN